MNSNAISQRKYLIIFYATITVLGTALIVLGASLNTIMLEFGAVVLSVGIVEFASKWFNKPTEFEENAKNFGLVNVGFEDSEFLEKEFKKAKNNISITGLNLHGLIRSLNKNLVELLDRNKRNYDFTLKFYICEGFKKYSANELGKSVKSVYKEVKPLVKELIKSSEGFKGEISLYEYTEIPYCSLILIDNKRAIWTPYLYTLTSKNNIRFLFNEVFSENTEKSQFQYFHDHYYYLSNENERTKCILCYKDGEIKVDQ